MWRGGQPRGGICHDLGRSDFKGKIAETLATGRIQPVPWAWEFLDDRSSPAGRHPCRESGLYLSRGSGCPAYSQGQTSSRRQQMKFARRLVDSIETFSGTVCVVRRSVMTRVQHATTAPISGLDRVPFLGAARVRLARWVLSLTEPAGRAQPIN